MSNGTAKNELDDMSIQQSEPMYFIRLLGSNFYLHPDEKNSNDNYVAVCTKPGTIGAFMVTKNEGNTIIQGLNVNNLYLEPAMNSLSIIHLNK